MKRILPFILLVMFSCKKEEEILNTKVQGVTLNVKDSTKIFLNDFYFYDVGGYIDSTYIIDNKFEFNFELSEPRSFQLNGLNTSAKHLIVSPGITNLSIKNFDSIHNVKIINAESVTLENEEYFKKYGYENDLDYITENPNKLTSLWILWEDRYSLENNELKKYYESLSDRWKNHTIASDIENLLSSDYNPKIGIKFQDFELKDANNNLINLNNFKGKYLLIEYTATWCGPCIAQIPFQKSAYDKFKNKGFEILHIYLQDKQTMINSVNDHEIPWKTVYAPMKFRSKIAMNNRVNYLPNMFLLDKNHKIIGTTLNPMLLFENLDIVLEENIK